MKHSFVVPCFNEENNIIPFTQRLREVFSEREYEIVFVDDGSGDSTLLYMEQVLNEKKENVKILSFSRNFGKEAAMLAGLKEADGDYVTLIDADLQQDPSYVLEMSAILDENPQTDMVCAYQSQRKESGLLTFFKTCFYSAARKTTGLPFRKDASDFRTFRRNVLEAILSLSEKRRFSKGIFAFVGFRTQYIPYEVRERNSGKSKWNLGKLLSYGIGGILSFTVKPLKLPLYLGIFDVFCSVLLFVIFAFTDFNINTVIVSLMFLLTGTVLLSLGVFGEYAADIFTEGKNRPVYIIRKREVSETEDQ